jgi:hypothetical protein
VKKLKPENHIKINAEIVSVDGRDYAKLTYQNASIKKQIPIHLRKLPPEESMWQIQQIFKELQKKLGRKLGLILTSI